MSLYPQYKNEAEFRDSFIKPLLNRMGFYGVEQQHGSQEFGKDFVFSELHRLGGIRHYAAQVKHEEKISQGGAVDNLLSQIKQAFNVPFTRADSPRECFVAAVYVFNSGEITANARDQIAGALHREHYGDNVHIYDGDRLEALNQWSAYQVETDARTRLLGLRNQIELNGGICEALNLYQFQGDDVPKVNRRAPDGRGFIWSAVEGYLSQPLPGTDELYRQLTAYWQLLRNVDSIRFRLYTGTVNRVHIQTEILGMQTLIKRVSETANSIITQIEIVLSHFSKIV